jgi:pfkB family carbohydrate kinase
VLAAAAPGSWVVLCGSLPPGLRAEAYATLTHRFVAAGLRVVVDTSGPAFRAAVAVGPELVKPNAEELAEAVGRPLRSRSAVVAAARELPGPRGSDGAREPRCHGGDPGGQLGGKTPMDVCFGQAGDPGGRGVERDRVGRLGGFDGQGDSPVGFARARVVARLMRTTFLGVPAGQERAARNRLRACPLSQEAHASRPTVPE